MGHCYHHALSSVRKWGGEPEDYLSLHQWFDEPSKLVTADFRHRARRHAVDLAFAGRIVVGQHGQGELGAVDKAGSMTKATMFKLEAGPLITGKAEATQLAHLPFELLALADQGVGTFAGGPQQLLGVAPGAEGNADFADLWRQPGMGIEQGALGIRPKQRLVRMLAMNINQPFTNFT